MRGIFKRANALIVITVFCSPSLAADGKSFRTVSGEEKLSPEPKPGKAAQLDRLFPDELKYWPDLKRVDKLLNRKPFQTFTSLESLVWLDGGKTLMVGDRSGFAVWDVASQRLVRRLPTKAWNGGIARASRDGKRFLTTGHSTKTQVLDWPTLKITQSIDARAGKDGKSGELALVEISPDGKYMAAIVGFTRKSFMRIFNCDTGEMLLEQVTDREICSMAWDPRNRFVVLGESRGTVIFRSLKGELIRRGIRLEPADKPRSLSMSPDGLRLAIGAEKYVGVYAISGRRKLWEQKADDFERFDHLMKLRFSSDGKEVVGLGYTAHDKTALVAWDADTGKEKRSRVVSSYYTSEMEVSPDGKLIAVEGWNQTLTLCDAHTFKLLVVSELAGDRSIVNGHNFPSGICPSPDGKRFLLIGWAAVMMWDIEPGRELWTVTRPQAVHAASWSSTGKWFAFTRDGVSDDVMETASFEVIAAEDGHVMRRLRLEDAKGGPVLVLSDDRIVVCSQNHVLLFDTEGREIWKTHLGGGNKNVAVAVSEDETKIGMVRLGEEFSEYSHGRVALLDLSTGKHLRDLRSVTTPYRVVFSPDGKQLYATAYGTPRARGDVQVLLEQWDVATGVRVNNPHVPDDPKHGEDYVSVYPDHLSRAIIDRSPLLATSYSSTSARLGVSPDGSWLVFEKPFASGEREENGIPKWSKRLLLWDLVNSKSLGEITLPGWIRDVAILKDGRIAVLNQNGTVFVMRRPDAHVKDIPKPEASESNSNRSRLLATDAQFVSFVDPDSAAESSEESEEVRRVEGRVLDHEGNGVAKADVWLPVRYVDPKTTAYCQTDEDGQFVLEVPESWLSPVRSQNGSIVWAYKKGHAIATASAQQALFSRMSNHPIEVQLGKATDTSFVVRDPDGKPLPGAMVAPVHFRSSLGYSLVPPEIIARVGAKTDPDGRARLPNLPREGLLNVRIVSEQFGSQQKQMDVQADAPAERPINLRPVGKVKGRVVSDEPKWARGVRFYLTTTGVEDGTAPTSGTAMVVTDAEGRFQVAALAEGSMRIEGGVKQEAPVRTSFPRAVTVSAGLENEILIRLVSGVVAHGSVRTKDRGAPVAGVRVSIRYGQFRQGDDVISDKDGRFTARVLPGPVYQQIIEIPAGKEFAEIRVGPPSEARFVVPDGAPECNLPAIELVPTVRVPGRLLDKGDQPVGGVIVYGVRGGQAYGYSRTDNQGRFMMLLPIGMRMDYYQTSLGDRDYRLEVKQKDPLLLKSYLPLGEVP